MGRAKWNMVIIINIKGYGRMMLFKVMVNIIILILLIMKECLKMEKETVKEHSIIINNSILREYG